MQLVLACATKVCRQHTVNNATEYLDMATATYNGTCQCCGRAQAVLPKDATLAKHGYTVDWGFFNGTCSGSGNLPLEQDTTVLDATAAALREHAAGLIASCDEPILELTVEHYTRDQYGRRVLTSTVLTEETWAASKLTHGSWADGVRQEIRRREYRARQLEAHAADLVDLRAKRYGQPLIPRKVESAPQREQFSTYREAAARVAELKQQGVAARQRREGWSSRYIVTYRKQEG